MGCKVHFLLSLLILLHVVGSVAAANGAASLDVANVLSIRGGARRPRSRKPKGSSSGGSGEYYEQFDLDYGREDNERLAGAMRGFIKTGNIAKLKEDDPFLSWWNQYLESGRDPVEGRLKPFYAADFGDKSDLSRGENPKIIIVSRKMKTDGSQLVESESSRGQGEVDYEVRNIWQPWLKARCNFAVRYIVPSRVDIVKIMDAKGRFESRVNVEEDSDGGKGRTAAFATMRFRPSPQERLIGKRDVVVKRRLPDSVLEGRRKRDVSNYLPAALQNLDTASPVKRKTKKAATPTVAEKKPEKKAEKKAAPAKAAASAPKPALPKLSGLRSKKEGKAPAAPAESEGKKGRKMANLSQLLWRK